MNRPYTLINVAMTVDGKLDTFERKGALISSERDMQRVDELRAAVDGIMVGGRTLLDEDPKLTVKSEALRSARVTRGQPGDPAKIGVATISSLRPDAQFLSAGAGRVVIFTTTRTSKDQLDTLRRGGVQVFVHDGPRVNLPVMMTTLKEIGIDHLMVEGGGTLNFELLRSGLVDEITAFVAPMLFGGANAPTLADGPGLAREQALPLQLIDIERWDDGGLLLRYKTT